MTQSLSSARQPARAATAAFIGTMIEWYDFYIYATAAALVFGELYFPSHDRFVSTMASSRRSRSASSRGRSAA